MLKNLTPELALKYAKMLTMVNFTIPVDNPTRFKIIRLKCFRFLACTHIILLAVPIMYTILNADFKDTTEVIKMAKLFSVITAIVQVPWQTLFLAPQYDRLQFVISEMENYFKYAKKHEREVYQNYINKCKTFYTCSVLATLFTLFGLFVGPFVTDDILPLEAKYPFDVTREPIRTIIHLHQGVCIWQCTSSVYYFVLFGMLVWFTTARFELLSNQFRNATSNYDIIAGIREHIKLLSYAEEIIIAIHIPILIVIIIVTISIVTGGLIIVSNAEMIDKAQFVILCTAGLFEVYSFAWPADYLMDASTSVADAIYDSKWYNQCETFKSSVLYIVFRSQTPTVVQVSSMIPVLSLNYFASYTSTAFSYLMTLRIIFLDE